MCAHLHYYDEIGLLKPTEITETGYRLYDDEALRILQQILFFKEFDMSEYYNVLEEFKEEHEEKVIKMYGSIDKYNEFVEKCKSKEEEIAKAAIKQYGNIERYAKAIKNNLNNITTSSLADQFDKFKKDCIEAVDKKYGGGASKFIGEVLKKCPSTKLPKIEGLYNKLTSDLSKNPYSKEVQEIVHEIADETKKQHQDLKVDNGENYWGYTADIYLSNATYIKVIDEKYGNGASKFIGEALKFYSENSES